MMRLGGKRGGGADEAEVAAVVDDAVRRLDGRRSGGEHVEVCGAGGAAGKAKVAGYWCSPCPRVLPWAAAATRASTG